MTEAPQVQRSKICKGCRTAFGPESVGHGNYKKAKYCGWACYQKAKRPTPESVAERFWAKVDMSLGPKACWIWMGAITTHGYGCTQHHGRVLGAHKVSYLLTKGEVPAGMEIMHACDSRPCVNQAHLSVGTRQDNCEDKAAKGRHGIKPFAEHRKLTPDKVLTIRSLRGKASSGEVAAMFNITQSYVFGVWGRRVWRNI